MICTDHDNRGNGLVLREGKYYTCQGRLGRRSSCFSARFPFAPALPNLARERRSGGWLPLAPVALQGFVAGFRALRAPLQPDGLAVWGRGRSNDKPTARQLSSCAQTRGVDMTRHDPEIEELRDKVHCAVVLEQTPAVLEA